MKKRMLSWGLALSLFLTLLPLPALAAEDTLSGDGQLAAAAAQCSCGAQPDEAGVVTHAEGCPLAVQEEVTPGTEEEQPVQGTEEEQPVQGPEEEQPAQGAEEEQPAQGTEEPEPEALTPPALTCEPLDEENSSAMVLTVAGDWDSAQTRPGRPDR